MKILSACSVALMMVGSAMAQPPTAPVLRPIDKPPFEPKPMSQDEKMRLMRENSQRRHDELKARWEQGLPVDGKPTALPIQIDGPIRDIGRVFDDGPIKVPFRFRNVSDHSVRITHVKATCGCTVPTLAKDTYAPGEEGVIDATYDPKGRRGLEFKDIDVQVDTPGMPTLKLGFLVETQPRVRVEPATVFLGELRKGATAKQTLSVIGREPGFDVTEASLVDASSPFSITRIGKSEIAGEGDEKLTSVEFEVAAKPLNTFGRFATKLILSTSDANRPTVEVAVASAVLGDLRVEPERVFITGQAGQVIERTVNLSHRQGKPFRILGVHTEGVSSDLALVVDLASADTLAPAGEISAYAMKIGGTMPGTARNMNGKIVVRTDVPDQPTIEIPVQGVMPVASK